MIIVTLTLMKSFVFNFFSVHTKRKAGVFKFLRFAERLPSVFEKLRFRYGLL